MKLTDEQVARDLASLTGWVREGHAIEKPFAFPSFPDALAFLVRLGFEAESADHHPDITINYRTVTLSFSTHSEGGITAKDLEGARTAERLYSSLGSRPGDTRG